MPISPPPHATRVFKGVIHDIWQWDQELFDGSRATFECMTRPDTVAVIAFLDPHTVLLTEQQHSGRDSFLDVAGGRMEAGETPHACAMREFLEETGYVIGRLQLFREIPLRGSARLIKHVYLATNLTPSGAGMALDAGEHIVLRPTPWQDAVTLCLQNTLRGQESMLAILAMEFDPDARKVKEQFLAS